MSPEQDDTPSVLFDFVDMLARDRGSGSLLSLAHYLGRFPGYEEEIAREYLASLESSQIRAPTAWTQPGGDHGTDTAGFGHYRVIRELGRGGQGVVLLAVDARLGRQVALKVLTSPLGEVSTARRNRLKREAEVIARLDHPGICGVYEAVLEGETPFLAMPFVEGETLRARVAAARNRYLVIDDKQRVVHRSAPVAGEPKQDALFKCYPATGDELRSTLHFFERVARALHAAHEAGVVHRDIKPANVMITADGLPVILDFGLARDEQTDLEELTRTGETFGTPGYMSPEQLDGNGPKPDRRTDVYSLGVVLYECLTLTRPFGESRPDASLYAIRTTPPSDPRALNPTLPEEVAVVLNKAVDREPARRYASALEFAEDVRRIRQYEPIHARPASSMLRFRRWAQRHRQLAATLIGTLLLLGIGLVLSLMALARVSEERNQKQIAVIDKDRALEETRKTLVLYEGAYTRQASTEVLPKDPRRALELAIHAAEIDPGPASDAALLAGLVGLHEKVFDKLDDANDLDVSPAGDRLVSASDDHSASLWDWTSKELARLVGHTAAVQSARFSPDGTAVLTGSSDGTARLWHIDGSAEPVIFAGHQREVVSAEFSADGLRIVTVSLDKTACIWDAQSGLMLRRLTGHTGVVTKARFSRDGRIVLTLSGDRDCVDQPADQPDSTVRVWDSETGAELARLEGHAGPITGFLLLGDGSSIVTTSYDGTIRVFDLTREQGLVRTADRIVALPGPIHAIALSPDETRIACAYDAGARILDARTMETDYDLAGHDGRVVVAIGFRPNSAELWTIGEDRTLRTWNASNGRLLDRSHGTVVNGTITSRGMLWSPDGRNGVTWGDRSRSSVRRKERSFLGALLGHTGLVGSVRFDSTGTRILTASHDGTARLWDAFTYTTIRVFEPKDKRGIRIPLSFARFDPDGERILAGSDNGSAFLWDVASGALIADLSGHSGRMIALGFGGHGSQIITVNVDGTTHLWDLEAGRVKVLTSTSAFESARFCLRQDRVYVVTSDGNPSVQLWSMPAAGTAVVSGTDELLWTLEPCPKPDGGWIGVNDVCLSPDAELVAASFRNGETCFIDARTCQYETPCVNTAELSNLSFSADSQFLFATSKWTSSVFSFRQARDGTWVARALQDAEHFDQVTSAAVADVGHLAVTGSADATVKVWDLDAGRCKITFTGHNSVVWDVQFSPDGTRVVSASSDGTARVWPVDLLGAARQCLAWEISEVGSDSETKLPTSR